MKKYLAIMVCALALTACATYQGNNNRAASRKQLAAQVEDSVYAQTFTVDFDYVIPLRMQPHYLTSPYSITIVGDSVNSYLPYFGRAYRSEYGETQSPLSFEAPTNGYRAGRIRDGYRIMFETRRGQEVLLYNLDIYDNAKASLNVSSTDRDNITFNGEMRVSRP